MRIAINQNKDDGIGTIFQMLIQGLKTAIVKINMTVVCVNRFHGKSSSFRARKISGF